MKRALSTNEIESILSLIDKECVAYNIPKEAQNATNNSIKNNLREQLIKIKIFPEGIDRLKDEIVRYYHSTQIQPGASVGIVTAQSIGERQTQMTLNTFHSAGMAIATVITGVPRFGELLNATTNPKMVSCQIYFKSHDQDIDTLRKWIGSDLRQFTLKDLTVKYTVEKQKSEESWYHTYLLFNDTIIPSVEELCDPDSEYVCISIQLNAKILYEYMISIASIAEKLADEYEDIVVIPSPLEQGKLDIFISMNQISMNDGDIINTEEARQLYVDNVVIATLFDIVVCGIPGITNFFFKKYNSDDKFMSTCSDFDEKSGWMVETQGSNYQQLLAHPKMRTAILISNNMWDIYEALGVEAARQFLIDEFMNVVSSDGTYINVCHVMLLVDMMTFAGSIASISRYGIKRDQAGPLAKASFEESLDNFLKAGVFGDVETTKGVSASIMCGKRSNIGTGLCDLLYKIDGAGPSGTNETLSTDPVKESVFTDLSEWMKATKTKTCHRSCGKSESDSEDSEELSDDLSSILSDASDDHEPENNDSTSSDSDDQDDSHSYSEESDELGEDPDELIFDDEQMDGFMDII